MKIYPASADQKDRFRAGRSCEDCPDWGANFDSDQTSTREAVASLFCFGTFWHEFPDPSVGAITVRHLLTHRSGLKHWGAVKDSLDEGARLRHDISEMQALIAAIELRSDHACDRAAPIYEAWLESYPKSRYQSTALIGAADCRLTLGDRERARGHIERLTQLEPNNSSLTELRHRLASR